MLDVVLELIAPLKCAGCDAPGAALCEACWSQVQRIDPMTACPRCGAPGSQAGCMSCTGRTHSLRAVRCFGLLSPPLSTAVALHKDPGERRYGPMLGALAATACADWVGWPDVVTPVPPRRSARLRRGYDHTLPLAHVVGARLEAPVARLLRAHERADQRGLARAERMANVREAFSVLPDARVPRRVLLVDDVLTTGATLEAAASVLKQAGAVEVRAVTVARAARV